MNQKTLVTLFVIALGLGAIGSAYLHIVPMLEQLMEEASKMSIHRIGATAFFIFLAECLRAIFVVSNTAVRKISKVWGWVMIFASLGITAALGVSVHNTFEVNDPMYWFAQTVNALVLFAEWSIGTVVAGYMFDWDSLTADLINTESMEYDWNSQGTKGKINWDKIPAALKPLKQVVEAVHEFMKEGAGVIDQLKETHKDKMDGLKRSHKRTVTGLLEELEAVEAKIDQAKTDCEDKTALAKLGALAANQWIGIGGANGGYRILCAGPYGKADCEPFNVNRNVKHIACPRCGKVHNRANAQERLLKSNQTTEVVEKDME